MNNEHHISFEDLLNLAKGKLSKERATTIKLALETDPLLRESYEGVLHFIQNEEETPEDFSNGLKEKMNTVFATDQELTSHHNLSESNKPKKWYWLGGVAAVLVLGFFAWSLSQPNTSDYDFTDAGLSVTLSINDQKLAESMNAYKLKDYSTAQDLLLQELAVNPGNDTLNYYLGVIAKENKNYNQAQNYFTQVPESSYFYQKAEYQLALTFWYVGDKKMAYQQFTRICTNSEHLFYKKAKSALNELN